MSHNRRSFLKGVAALITAVIPGVASAKKVATKELTADQIRGLKFDNLWFDGVQELDTSLIPVIQEMTSGSPYGEPSQFTSTPKTLDNTVEELWNSSPQARSLMQNADEIVLRLQTLSSEQFSQELIKLRDHNVMLYTLVVHKLTASGKSQAAVVLAS